ncbi:hypothetical protein P43SY_008231 [Pythium insidiosum]|uniref:TKL protein kinase n=1 Tax=Pythium insidiosum TaxID=114742 RepID=A0AAD5Q7K3_PYTIN|nr:hypothetical protein P43SY_008231 [Pythium insidiosum]
MSSQFLGKAELSSVLVFGPAVFAGLSNLKKLTFDRITFQKNEVFWQGVSQLKSLNMTNLNATDVSMQFKEPSSLEQVDFSNSTFRDVPKLFYERKYAKKLRVINPPVQIKGRNGVYKLKDSEIENIQANVDAVNDLGITLASNCSPVPGGKMSIVSSDEGTNSFFLVQGGSTTSPESSAMWDRRTSTLSATEIDQIRIPMDSLVVGDEISQGAFGRVYEGSYKGEKVAIKRLAPHRRQDLNQFLLFVDEARLMASLQHPRILRFIGIAWDSPLDIHVITEYMKCGDLRRFLVHCRDQQRPNGFDRTKLKIALHIAEGLAYLHAQQPQLKIALHIAEGLAYLHAQQPQVLHRDLKSSNVLLSPALDAKLIDFGVSRTRADHTMTVGVGTLRWMAPEVMSGGRYGESADVFSFGVILSELDTHELPYTINGEPVRDEAILVRVSMGTLQTPFTSLADQDVVGLARECMALLPEYRPLASDGEQVAIKRLAPHRRKDLKQLLSFVEEAKLVASMQHPRIIRFIGIAWDSPIDIHVVTEYMEQGDLDTHELPYTVDGQPLRDEVIIARVSIGTLEVGFSGAADREVVALALVDAATFRLPATCSNATLSFEGGARVVCADGKPVALEDENLGTQVHVFLAAATSRLTIQPATSPTNAIKELAIMKTEAMASSPTAVALPPTALEQLKSIASLTLENVHIEPPNVVLRNVPSLYYLTLENVHIEPPNVVLRNVPSLYYLKLINTDASDVSLELPPDAASSLSIVRLDGTKFATIPRLLYERPYKQIAVEGLEINMEEVELECAVYGDGTVFPVKIARDAKVSALQEAIFDKKRYKERYSFDASVLTLYLAKKDGVWLKDDDSVDDLLSGKIDTVYKKMRPSWKLDDKELLGSNIDLGEKNIHVLVELPAQQRTASIKKQLRYKKLVVADEIQQGAYGRVFHGAYNGKPVAIKRLTPHLRKKEEMYLSFVNEAKLMASMQHPRIIRFIGIAWDSPLDIHVVTEYMEQGDLRRLLVRYRKQNRPTGFSNDKLKIALHIAQGLAYMHAHQPQVLHRDLKSSNVLLTTDLDAKLIDFGVSRERADHTMTVGVGTLRWMAPEVMSGGRYGDRADVFSFGVILSELDTHELPYSVDGQPLRDEVIIARVSMGTLELPYTVDGQPLRDEVIIARVSMGTLEGKANVLIKRDGNVPSDLQHLYERDAAADIAFFLSALTVRMLFREIKQIQMPGVNKSDVRFQGQPFSQCPGLQSLSFTGVNFVDPSVSLQVQTLQQLKVIDTNAQGISLNSTEKSDFELTVDFAGTIFPKLPALLYERKYKKLSTLKLNIGSPSVLPLNKQEFDNLDANLKVDPTLQSFIIARLRIPMDKLVVEDELRQGAYGRVFHGAYNGEPHRKCKSKRVLHLAPLPGDSPVAPPDDRCEPDASSLSPSRAFPRLLTLARLAETHVHELRHGAFVRRSQLRWLAFESPPVDAESDARRAWRVSRESAALVLQSAWRRAIAARLRRQMLRAVWTEQTEVAAWICRDLDQLRSLRQLLYAQERHEPPGQVLLRVASFLRSTHDRMDGLCFHYPARVVAAWLRFECTRRRARFLRRPPAILHAIDLPVRRSRHLLMTISRLVAETAAAAEKIVERAVLLLQTMFRARRARVIVRGLVRQREQTRWQRNPSKGYMLFDKGLYSQAAVYLERCLREGIFQGDFTSRSIDVKINAKKPATTAFPTGSRLSFSFSATPSENRSGSVFLAPNSLALVGSRAGQLKFWLAFSLSHFYSYEAGGDRLHLQQARLGFESFLQLEAIEDSRSTSPFTSEVCSLVRLHIRFRLVQCMYWDQSDVEKQPRATVLDCCVELLDELELSAIGVSADGQQQLRDWRIELHMIAAMLYIEAHEIDQSIAQLELVLRALPHVKYDHVAVKFLVAVLLLRRAAASRQNEAAPAECEEDDEDDGDERDIADDERRAETLLQQIYQELELDDGIGFVHQHLPVSPELLLQDAAVGSFLLHVDDPNKVSLHVKRGQSPLKVSSLRIDRDGGIYTCKKLPNSSHFSLHGLVRSLPFLAFDLGVRATRDGAALDRRLHRFVARIDRHDRRSAAIIDWSSWLDRLRVNRRVWRYTRRNEVWSTLCWRAARSLSLSEAFTFSALLAREALDFSRDREHRAELASLQAQAALHTHRRKAAALAMQHVMIEAQGRLADCVPSFLAMRRAWSRDVAVSRLESFATRVERAAKLERMTLRAWTFDSLATTLRGRPFCEALLLQKVLNEQSPDAADTAFLRSLLRAHVRNFVTASDGEQLHLSLALVAVERLFERFQTPLAVGSKEEELALVLQQHLEFRERRHRRRRRAFGLDVLLISWHRMPFQLCFEMAEVFYRSVDLPQDSDANARRIDMYESLYGRLRGLRPRSWAYSAYEELFLVRLAFLHAQNAMTAQGEDDGDARIARLRQAVGTMDELIALRRMRLLAARSTPLKTIVWPSRLRLPIAHSFAELSFLRGVLCELLDDAKHRAPDHRKCWRDYDELHRELLEIVLAEQAAEQLTEQRRPRQALALQGVRVFVGESSDVGFRDLLHSQPVVVVQCEGVTRSTQQPPTWVSLTPTWSEHVEIDVASPKARIVVTLENRSRRRRLVAEKEIVGTLQVSADDVLRHALKYAAAKMYDLTPQDAMSTRRPRLRLSFHPILKPRAEEKSSGQDGRKARKRQRTVWRGAWSLPDLQQHLQGDLRAFVQSPWVWRRLGHRWLQDKDFAVAAWLLHRAVTTCTLVDDPEHALDLIGLATCYRATMTHGRSEYTRPLLHQAHAILTLALQRDGDSASLWKQLQQVTAWLSEAVEEQEAGCGPLARELAKAVPASSHWIRLTIAGGTQALYFNQDTRALFLGVESESHLLEPLEFEASRAADVVSFCRRDSRRMLLLPSAMQARVRRHCQAQQQRQASDPRGWIAVYNQRSHALQYASTDGLSLELQTTQPPTYAAAVDERTMYHVLVLQDSVRRFLRRRRRQRKLRGLFRTVAWFAFELLAARRRLHERAELRRKRALNCLHVVVERARGLRVMDLVSSDPFVELELVAATGETFARGQTGVRRATLNPKWEEEFELHYEYLVHERHLKSKSAEPARLRFVVKDHDIVPLLKDEIPLDVSPPGEQDAARESSENDDKTKKKPSKERHDFLGLTVVPVDGLEHGRCVTAELPLKDEDGYESPRSRGTLTITVQWMHLAETRAKGWDRRHAITPDILVRGRRRPRPKPAFPFQASLFAELVAATDELVRAMAESLLFLEQLVRLYRRLVVAQRAGRTAEEAKLLERRLHSVMATQFPSKRRELLERAVAGDVRATALHTDMLPLIADYVDACDPETARKHQTMIELAADALASAKSVLARCQAARKDEELQADGEYPVIRFPVDAASMLDVRQLLPLWRQALAPLIAQFFEDAPLYGEAGGELVAIEQMESLALQVATGGKPETSSGSRATTPLVAGRDSGAAMETLRTTAPLAGAATAVPAAPSPAVDAKRPAPSQNAAVARRLERIEKEKRRKQQRGK